MSLKSLLLASSFLTFFLASYAQDTLKRPDIPVDDITGLITYKEVVTEKGSPDELYVRAVEWISSFFKNPSEVTRTRDRDNGLIKGVHRFKLNYIDEDGQKREMNLCEYEFTLEFKEGRYRYTLTNFCLKEASRQHIERWLNTKDPAYNAQWDNYLLQVDTFAKDWAAAVKKGMKPPLKKDDNW